MNANEIQNERKKNKKGFQNIEGVDKKKITPFSDEIQNLQIKNSKRLCLRKRNYSELKDKKMSPFLKEKLIHKFDKSIFNDLSYNWLFKDNVRMQPIFNFKFSFKNKLYEKLTFNIRQGIKNIENSEMQTIQFLHFNELKSIILRFMKNKKKNISEINKISENEKLILHYMLEKKTDLIGNNPKNIKLTSEIFQNKFKKRLEENLKLVFSKAFSFLQENFKKTFKDNLSEYLSIEMSQKVKSNEYSFFVFYFEETALRLDQEIEKFFSPRILNKKKKRSSEIRIDRIPKTLSRVYLNNIGMSTWFMEHFRLYVNKVFLKEQTLAIQTKVLKLLNKWESLIEEYGINEGIKMIIELFRGRESNKFSWTVKDLENALSQTLSSLSKD